MTANGQLRLLVTRDKVDGAWRESAKCRFAEPELFFPEGDPDPDDQTVKQAKAMCRACPVREDCLLFALETKQVDGIWGGTTEIERRRLRRAWVAARRLRAG